MARPRTANPHYAGSNPVTHSSIKFGLVVIEGYTSHLQCEDWGSLPHWSTRFGSKVFMDAHQPVTLEERGSLPPRTARTNRRRRMSQRLSVTMGAIGTVKILLRDREAVVLAGLISQSSCGSNPTPATILID